MSQIKEKKEGLEKNRKFFPEKNFNPLNFYVKHLILNLIPSYHFGALRAGSMKISTNGAWLLTI